ncbi:MAG TPA: hypothetical protein VHS31_07255 [Tepidisphaeraceae bacterium]|jgi:hypothetical protein|nr:hypothetical protein [Tepidisphaeraceae bacterium]
MRQWEIHIGRAWDAEEIGRAIESIAESHELTISLKGSLRAHRGCVHWHFKKAKQSGTIEVTMWPQERRVWLSVQSGRAADWIENDIETMMHDLERALSTEH